MIVPDGVLFGPSKAHKSLRRQLLFLNTLEAVVSLPPNVFQPYSGVKTSILVFQRAQDADTACAYAVGSDDAYAVLDFLNSFGYANPVYELPDLCLEPTL